MLINRARNGDHDQSIDPKDCVSANGFRWFHRGRCFMDTWRAQRAGVDLCCLRGQYCVRLRSIRQSHLKPKRWYRRRSSSPPISSNQHRRNRARPMAHSAFAWDKQTLRSNSGLRRRGLILMPHRSNYWSDCLSRWGRAPMMRKPTAIGSSAGERRHPHRLEASAFRMARLGYQPRGAKFPHTNELSLVRDLPISLVERALPFVTVYSGRPQINILDAAPEVIAALPGMTQDRAECIPAAAASFAGHCDDPAAEGRAAVCND